MREIKFRGVGERSGEFVYGDLIHGVGHKEGSVFILPLTRNLAGIPYCDPLDGVKVIPETLGQFTGFKDSNGIEIYEGDIIQDTDDNTLIVTFIKEWAMFGSLFDYELERYNNSDVKGLDESMFWTFPLNENIKVIGNIHQNPELLKTEFNERQ